MASEKIKYQKEFDFISQLCDEIDKFTLKRFKDRDFSVMTKDDMSPVTEVDRETEIKIRDAILDIFPDDKIEGEEFGKEIHSQSRTWIIDPIDGTKNFLRGVPVWGTLIAFCVDDIPMAGTASAPSLHRRWMGLKNGGAFVNGESISVSKTSKLEDVQASYGDVTGFEKAGYPESLNNLNKFIWRARGMGDFWSHMLVAEGAIDLGLDTHVQPYDVAPLKLIVEEAGGRTTSFDGKDSFREPTFVSTNGLIHDEIIKIIISGK
ncbi:MAG: histidinol-phosphatase [Acidimicrobiia bacterium]|nr:histidinol-phosphatase [Acidimicrobiia bacterium]